MFKKTPYFICVCAFFVATVAVVSCSPRNQSCSNEVIAAEPDTLVTLTLKENLPDFVTREQAYHSNIGITGRTGNWEERQQRMEVDVIYRSPLKHKVMKLYGNSGWGEISESPVTLYNYDSPILFFADEVGPVTVPDESDFVIDTSSVFCSVNDCRFGPGRLTSLFSKEKAIAVPDSSMNVKPVFYSSSENGTTLYSYITICKVREKIILICSIPETKLEETEEGRYLLNCICNYLYYGSNKDLLLLESIKSKQWFKLGGIDW